MPISSRSLLATACFVLLAASAATADQQQIAPGTGDQSSVVIHTGPDGICDSTAAEGDIQAAPVGQATPNRSQIRCGGDKVSATAAAGDDVQLVAVGVGCKNANTPVVDTGADGIPNSTPAGDDTYLAGMALGVPPASSPCVLAGADGVAQSAIVANDDVQALAGGTAEANSEVVLCGPNLVADSTANNFALGDDVQVVAVGNPCAEGDVVVDSGPDGIASTMAEGPDLRIAAAKPIRITIPGTRSSGSRLVKLKVSNVEYGATAPASRTYRLATSSLSCPNGVVTQLDADSTVDGLQATATVAKGMTKNASLVATVQMQNITTPNKKNAYRCTFDVSVIAIDTDPDVDDGENVAGNTTTVSIEAIDTNDY
jgi:hypothetical protein